MPKKSESTSPSLENLVEMAKAGNKDALEEVVRQIQDKIYGLALRMLYLPADAEDASQEILIKIITHLDSFQNKSRFLTWAYRIASNHLFNTRKRRAEKMNISFEYFEQVVDKTWSYSKPGDLDEGETRLLVKEVKLICTNAMLLALRREIRLAFIIGEIYGASSQEGAEILDITPDAFRQRLSRGRKQIRDYIAKRCGLVRSDNLCNCAQGIDYFTKAKVLDPHNPLFSTHKCNPPQKELKSHPVHELDDFGRITALFRSHPDYAAPEAFVGIVKQLVDSGRFELLNNH
jgi:RNA polymerase sigma factor (sigma-70 family)